MNATNLESPKIKFDIKNSKYATGRRKNLLQEFGLKRVLEKYILMGKK